jgi:uncharacterized Rmd1/YagE family protein
MTFGRSQETNNEKPMKNKLFSFLCFTFPFQELLKYGKVGKKRCFLLMGFGKIYKIREN